MIEKITGSMIILACLGLLIMAIGAFAFPELSPIGIKLLEIGLGLTLLGCLLLILKT